MTLKRGIIIFVFCLQTFLSFSQDSLSVISNIDKDLLSKRITISDVLTNSSYMYLHSLTAFREVIKRNANTEDITIVTTSEPGIRIVVNGTLTDKSEKPLANILVYFYHTSDKGWYSDTAVHIAKYEGDHRHSRLFGYVRTDSNGKFSIKTIRPNGYPNLGFAGHIHLQMWKEDGTYLLGIPGELQFDDDPRMTEQRRQKSISDGYLIANNDGTKEIPVYNYIIKAKFN